MNESHEHHHAHAGGPGAGHSATAIDPVCGMKCGSIFAGKPTFDYEGRHLPFLLERLPDEVRRRSRTLFACRPDRRRCRATHRYAMLRATMGP